MTMADVSAALGGVTHGTHVCFSVNGAGSTWNMGYPFDIGNSLNPNVWTHQPIGYDTSPFPMMPHVALGEAEVVRQLNLYRCQERTWGMVVYSMGAIVGSNILDRLGITKTPGATADLAAFADTFIAGSTFGNPRREAGHTLPGGIDPGGQGIVTPTLVGTPDFWWDFACGKTMAGSPGQDTYTTAGEGENATALADQRLVWNIVGYGLTVKGVFPLFTTVIKLLTSQPNFSGDFAAAEAAFNFFEFAFKGLTPHTTYQLVQPISGDPRSCWDIALDHLNDVGNSTTPRIPA
jgi:hypothetical protein